MPPVPSSPQTPCSHPAGRRGPPWLSGAVWWPRMPSHQLGSSLCWHPTGFVLLPRSLSFSFCLEGAGQGASTARNRAERGNSKETEREEKAQPEGEGAGTAPGTPKALPHGETKAAGEPGAGGSAGAPRFPSAAAAANTRSKNQARPRHPGRAAREEQVTLHQQERRKNKKIKKSTTTRPKALSGRGKK